MKTLLGILLILQLPFAGLAQEEAKGPLQFPKTDVKDVLSYYQVVTGKPVFLALDLHARVTIESKEPLSREAAIELIRKTLLESYGIELRLTDRGETLAMWSKDPKYPKRSDPPLTDAERSALPKVRVRPIPTR